MNYFPAKALGFFSKELTVTTCVGQVSIYKPAKKTIIF